MSGFGFGTPFHEQIQFLRNKLALPSERWDDIKRSAHDRAFIVAGARKADLVQDFHNAIIQRAADGKGMAAWRKDFDAIVQKHGWSGWTGQGSKAGEAWRSQIIYTTNMDTSYAAGRWRQLTHPDLIKSRPYLRYVHADGVRHPRLWHLAWNGTTLPWDDPFWSTHAAPNGWRCHCRIESASRGDFAEAKAANKAARPPGWNVIDPKTGAPMGIDRGFDYNPGANARRPMQDFIDQRLIKLDAAIGAAMWRQLKPVLAMERQLAWWQTLDAWLADEYPRGHTAIVGALDPDTLAWLAQNRKPPPAHAAIGVADKLPKGAKQLRHEAAQNALTVDEWRALPTLLDSPSAIYFDTRSGHLMFVSDGLGPTKAAIEFDPAQTREAFNPVVSAFRVSDMDVAGAVKGGVWEVVRVGRRPGGS